VRELANDRTSSARTRLRARIILNSAIGRSNREIARTLGVDAATVSFWRRRFALQRLEGDLHDAPRPGRPSSQSKEITERVLHATWNVNPPEGARWTTRTLARYLGVNHMRVHRTWKANGLTSGAVAGPLARTGTIP